MSIVKNVLFNGAITISSYITSFIVFPYISRIFGVENIGILGFVDNTINYFVLFVMLGVQSVGIREIAASNGNKERISEVFVSLFSLLFILLVVVGIIYFTVIISFPQFRQYDDLFLIGYIKLLFTPLLIDWLYAGLQDFKFISIRTIAIKILYVISIFVFVDGKDDLFIYFFLTSLSVLSNSIVNLFYAKKYVKFSLRMCRISTYISPVLKLGVFQLIISFYSTFNYIYLGIVSSETEVGNYYTAIKLYSIIMALFSAFTNVMMPQISSILDNNEKIDNLINKSFVALFTFSLPIIVVSMLLAPHVIYLIAGDGFSGAILPMIIVMPILLISGLNQINGVQILIPFHKDNILLVTSSLAAIVGLTINICLDSYHGACGAAIAILCSELVGGISGYFYSIKHKLISFPVKMLCIHLISVIPYLLIYYLMSWLIDSLILSIVVILASFIAYFWISQFYIIKNNLLNILFHA